MLLESNADEVSCENMKIHRWDIFAGELNTCLLMTDVAIITPDTSIASNKDETIEGILFDGNKRVKFLPVSVSEKFPNLTGISAWNCAIETVSNRNFKNLSHLVALGLGSNQIETIDENTFEDLFSLKKLYLRKLFKFFNRRNILKNLFASAVQITT